MTIQNCKLCYGRGTVFIDYILPKTSRFIGPDGKEVKSFGGHYEQCSCVRKSSPTPNPSTTPIKDEEIQIACGVPSELG